MPANLRIVRLHRDQLATARGVVTTGSVEFFGSEPKGFKDMDDLAEDYEAPGGTMLVLLDGEAIVGTGGIRRLDSETCELKRMWFLPPYRGLGYGRQMSEMLFEFARSAGYRLVRLDTDPRLAAANRLYARLGFRPIEPYNDGPCAIFMEKEL